MTAQKFLEERLKPKWAKRASVKAFVNSDTWYHVHRDEEIPKKHSACIAFPDYLKGE